MTKTIINILYLCFFPFFLSCKSKTPKLDAAYEAVYEYSKNKLGNKWDLTITGGSFYEDNFKIVMGYSIPEPHTIEDARGALVKTLQEFLIYINQSAKVRPYITHYPLTSKDIELHLLFLNNHKENISTGYIGSVLLLRNSVFYQTTSESKRDPFPIVLRESYEEALRIVKSK